MGVRDRSRPWRVSSGGCWRSPDDDTSSRQVATRWSTTVRFFPNARAQVPGDRRRSPPPDRGGGVRRRPAAAQRGRAVARATRASRVTVRKALELLRDEGLVDARQGFGWFVAADPCARPSGGSARSRTSSRRRASSRSGASSTSGSSRAPAGSARCSASTPCSRSRRVNTPSVRRRAVRPGHGVVPGRSRRRAVARRRGAVVVLRPARRRASAGRPRRSAPASAGPTTRSCSRSRRGRRCCCASG